MNLGRTVFSQVMDLLPLRPFRRCVQRYRGDRKIRYFSCLDQFLCMAFAQLTHRRSLRDTVVCLRAQQSKLYHMGIRGRVRRSTLADANRQRDWRIYADFAQVVIGIATDLYADEDLGLDLDATVYALDSTTINLCLALFPWARYQRTKGAIKVHTLLNLRGSIPEFIHITEGRVHDVNILDLLVSQPGAFYVMDRGYIDFARLYRMHQAAALFVTRARRRFQFARRYSRPVDKTLGLRCDQTIRLTSKDSATTYPQTMRRIVYIDTEIDQRFVFLTNDFQLPAETIARLYQARWHVELFFKWVKQHLRIQSFFGTSPNAVKTQVWIAVTVYVLVAIAKKRFGLTQSLYTILQVLTVTIFEKTPLFQVFSNHEETVKHAAYGKQLPLFDL